MISKFIFILMRGLGLFGKYLRANLVSMFALAALFTVLHTIFAIGGAMAVFADGAARFDTLRVYTDDAQGMAGLLAEMHVSDDIKVYRPEDTKKYIYENVPSVSASDSLPANLFPSFVEIRLAESYRNIESLKKLSAEISSMRGVDYVSYGGEWAEQMMRGRNATYALIAIAVLLFTVVAVVITYQTVSMTLYRYHKEIVVYNIVGGTAPFITFPFVVVAGVMALSCSFFSFLLYQGLNLFLLAPVSVALNLPIALSLVYWCRFVIIAVLVGMIAGFISAGLFLTREYHEE